MSGHRDMDVVFLRLHNIYRFIFLEATISHQGLSALRDWYNNISSLESWFLLYLTCFQLLKSNTTQSHLDFQVFNDIIYQNKFIKSIQKPLQSVAARKTVFGTHNRHQCSTEQHAFVSHARFNNTNALFSFSDTWHNRTSHLQSLDFNTFAHSKHFNVT